MALSTFIFRANKSGVSEIKYSGLYNDFSNALRNGKTVQQTQSNPDNEGNVYITITIEH